MDIIATSFGQFLPYVFVIAVVGLCWDMVIRAFTGGRL